MGKDFRGGRGDNRVESKRFSKPKIIVEPHRLPGVYISKNTKEETLITKNLALGE